MGDVEGCVSGDGRGACVVHYGWVVPGSVVCFCHPWMIRDGGLDYAVESSSVRA